MSNSLNKKEVDWIIAALSDFYWNKGGKSWGRKLKDPYHHLFFVMIWNKRGCCLVLSEEKKNLGKESLSPMVMKHEVGGIS